MLMLLFRKIWVFLHLAKFYVRPVNQSSWHTALQFIRARFPDIPHISTAVLSAWLADSSRVPPLLLDVRTPDEYGVSHLPGARPYADFEKAGPDAIFHAQPIVVYCSLGYRSAMIARKLRHAGFTEVYNLESSIFGWANEGRPIFRGETELRPPVVHPFNRKWGNLLKPELRAPIEQTREERL